MLPEARLQPGMVPENGGFNGTGNGACNQRLQWRRKSRLNWRLKPGETATPTMAPGSDEMAPLMAPGLALTMAPAKLRDAAPAMVPENLIFFFFFK